MASPKNQKSIEQLEKERKRSPLIIGGILIAIGILCLFIPDTSARWGMFALFCGIGIGLVAFILLKIRNEDRQLIPGTAEYEKLRQAERNEIINARNRLYTHKSLHDEVAFHRMMISGIILGVITIIDLCLIFLAGVIYYVVVIINVCMLGVFIFSLTGSTYKKILKRFAELGMSEQNAEEDFSRAMMAKSDNGSDIFSWSDNFIVRTEKQPYVIDPSDIVWCFGRLTYTYNYYNGVYTGRTSNHILIMCTKGGGYFDVKLSRGGMYAILEEIASKGMVCGYNQDIYDLYSSSPGDFKERIKEADFPLPSPDDIMKPEHKEK